MILLTPLELFIICFAALLIGVIIGLVLIWSYQEMTEGELRLEHHVRESDEHEEATRP